MKLTKELLRKLNACESSYKYACNNGYIGMDIITALEKGIKEDRLSDCNWLIIRVMSKKQQILYAIYAAEQVLYIFEKAYPEDTRPREAINAAKAYLANPHKDTKAAAYAAYAYATDTDDTLKISILNYGIELLKEG